MATYTYKSTTGGVVNIDNYVITPAPGLELKYQVDVLDSAMGTTLARYTDGVLDSSDSTKPVIGTFNAVTGGMELSAGGIPISNVVYTVAALPAATIPYRRAFVSDATTPAFGATVVGGGAVKAPVYSDGAAWKVG